MTIAKQLSRQLDDIPICSITNSPPGVDNIPINLWVDNSYREAFPDTWKDRLRLRILYVNDIFRPQFNVDFTIAKFIEWDSKFYRELDNTLDKLHSSVASNSNVLDIGITLNKELKRTWKTRKELGFAYLLSNNAVITAQPSYPSVGQNWNSIEEAITLAHEIGHIFGAIHVPDRNSIMYSSSGYMSFEFDELNKQIITVTKENFLKKSDSERLIVYSGELVKLKNYPTSNSTAILNPISSVVVQIDKRKKILSKDSDKTFNNLSKLLPDSVTILAVMGYLELKENNSDEAINPFTKVFNKDPNYVEAQYYLSLALKKNGENEEAVIYEEMYKPYKKLWVLE